MSEVINLADIGPVYIERYPHGGGRVWREDEDGAPDLVLDLYSPAVRRDAIIEKLTEDHAATVAALEGRVRELEKALSEACTACGCLHHAKRDQHGSADPCPVSARIAAALSPEAKP